MQWFAQAPANIALIKYMGKKDDVNNIPDNPSFSYTLNDLLSNVMLESIPGNTDFWEPLPIPGAEPFHLKIEAQQRFLKHLSYLKSHFKYSGAFIVRSSSNFPIGSGLASSASSFAALTKCTVEALCELTQKSLPSTEKQARLSQVGSGSSCRSFFSPWVLWDNENITTVSLPYQNLHHQVILVSHEEKRVSSSEAHKRVKTSQIYKGRCQQAKENLRLLLQALENLDWASAHTIVWREFQEMHQLFATSHPPFGYITPESNQLLKLIQDFWHRHGDGPLTTMDAGPNIHLLYREDQYDMAQKFKCDHLVGNFDVL